MTEYLVPAGPGEGELVEKRSRFIGQVWLVESEEAARACIESARKRHYDARHHCWCWRLKDGPERYSDDGEPQGTAGQPMLNVFQREDITNVCCVVTRYFGGILLGAGGLTRVYGGTAKLALDAAGVSRMRLWSTLAVPCSYSLYERMRLLTEQSGGVIADTDFGTDVVLSVLMPSELVERFRANVTELSAGGVEVLVEEEAFRPGPRENR